MVLTVQVKLLLILVVMILPYRSLTLSNYCADIIGDTNLGDTNVNTSCAVLSNMLNASWVTEEHVDSMRIDYTCTASGMEQVTGTVLGWGNQLSEGNALIEGIFPTARSPVSFEPTCFIDGCYDWTSPRAGFPTWSIPTVMCTVTPEIVETSSSGSPSAVTITPQLSSSFIPTKPLSSNLEFSMSVSQKEDPRRDQASAGLMPYMWLLLFGLISGVLSLTIFCVLIITSAKKRRRRHIVTSETAENQADQGNNTIAETVEHGDDSPHRLGTLSAQQLHKRSQLHPMGLLRSPGVISEHSKVPKTSEDTRGNTSENTEQQHKYCPGTLSVEQAVKRRRLPPLKLSSGSKDINKQLGRSKETQELITEHEANPTNGIRFKGDPHRTSSTQETLHTFQEPIQGNLTGATLENSRTGIHSKGGHWVDNLSNDSVQENAVKLQRPTSKDTASATASISAQQSVNSMLEDSNGRGERSPSQHKAMCHDSKVPDTNKGESSEDESTL